MIKNNVELVAAIAEARLDIPDDDIARAVVKMRKLAKTLRQRELGLESPYGDPVKFERNTQRFFDKAFRLAQGIRCTFGARKETNAPCWEYYVRIDDRTERLV
jgi:hypothetical protein